MKRSTQLVYTSCKLSKVRAGSVVSYLKAVLAGKRLKRIGVAWNHLKARRDNRNSGVRKVNGYGEVIMGRKSKSERFVSMESKTKTTGERTKQEGISPRKTSFVVN